MKFIIGIFLILHGIVYLLYFGQSMKFFELRPGMAWPEGSWAFSTFFGNDTLRLLGGIFCLIGAAGFIAGGIGILAMQPWWRPLVIAAAVFSSLIFILLWNGNMQNLSDKGGIGILINIVILAALLIFRWPRFEF
jgi:hypothetical protein